MRTLLIGGARSGKSSLAARWAGERSSEVCCVVTGKATDPEMAERIAAHRSERPAHWKTWEEPVRLAHVMAQAGTAGPAVAAAAGAGAPGPVWLVDCLTLWVANCLWPSEAGPDVQGWRQERDAFITALRGFSGDVILVTNEVGSGIVPNNAAARLFCDEHGWMNQAVAAVCDEVFLIAAGLPLRMKPAG
ncbi:MAG TPA: bifunctional adenosylcobinamide kinase/adenosylcobinamide-phosphate guanylyltransferase [Steroidobacteraceae bacterium]|jgi:adenosylcobinamide kinase/adenosylcobinamide-phosphate guanylyltransferase